MVNKPVVEKVSLRWYLATYSKLPVGDLFQIKWNSSCDAYQALLQEVFSFYVNK